MTDQSKYNHDFYRATFVEDGGWSTHFPNKNEILRASKIMAIVTDIANELDLKDTPLKILEVGSGRGWLSQMLTFYGDVQGVEPVTPVVEHARKTYPHLTFTVGTPQTILENGFGNHFDLVISSEVLEHVPYSEQDAFMSTIAQLLNQTGHLVLTTPRGEILDDWMAQYKDACQPIEDWLTEAQLEQLVSKNDLKIAQHMRFGTYSGALRKSILDRAILKFLSLIGYQYAEPARLSTYQIIHAKV